MMLSLVAQSACFYRLIFNSSPIRSGSRESHRDKTFEKRKTKSTKLSNVVLKMFLSLAIVISTLGGCWSYKVLLVPVSAGSHVISLHYIGHGLMNRGHEIHMLLHYEYKIPTEWTNVEKNRMTYQKYGENSGSNINLEEISTNLTLKLLDKNFDAYYLLEEMKKLNKLFSAEMLFGNEKILEYLDTLKFDAIVIDHIFFMRFPVVLAARLKLPLISYVDLIEPWLIRTPWFPSIHTAFMPDTDSQSTFFSRLINSIILIKSELFPPIPDPDDSILDLYRQHCDFKDLKAIIRNSVLFLTTDDPLFNVVRPYTANAISIGGVTTESLKQSSTIPDDYLKFIEDGESAGTIVLTFGSMVPKYPERLAKLFIDAFSRLSQYKFFWRFHNYMNLTIPINVKVVKWLAQRELLGHKSVKLFITHSGNNGQFEALYQGVPMLAVPIMGDQPRNAKRIVERGYGEQIDFRTIKMEELMKLIIKVAEDPSYKERIMKASEIFKSRPESPAERAAFWIEHVIKFGGDHLKPAGNDLYFWQYLCLDVLLFLQAVVVVGICLVMFVLTKLLKIAKTIISGKDLMGVNKAKKQK